MSLEMVAIDDALMREVFPFHIAFDRDLKVIQTGRALSRLMPEVQVGTALGDVLQIVTPNVPLDFERILDQSYTVFFGTGQTSGQSEDRRWLAPRCRA